MALDNEGPRRDPSRRSRGMATTIASQGRSSSRTPRCKRRRGGPGRGAGREAGQELNPGQCEPRDPQLSSTRDRHVGAPHLSDLPPISGSPWRSSKPRRITAGADRQTSRPVQDRSGPLTLERSNFDLPEHRPGGPPVAAAGAREGIELQLDVAPVPAESSTAMRRTRPGLLNLVGNAIKFTARVGHPQVESGGGGRGTRPALPLHHPDTGMDRPEDQARAVRAVHPSGLLDHRRYGTGWVRDHAGDRS